jgi:hypothetical protein
MTSPPCYTAFWCEGDRGGAESLVALNLTKNLNYLSPLFLENNFLNASQRGDSSYLKNYYPQ